MSLVACGSSIVVEDGGRDGGPFDGGPLSAADVDVTGTWRLCDASVTYRSDGSATWIDHRRSCSREGLWTSHGDALETNWTSSTCGEAPLELQQRALVAPQGLVLIDPSTGHVSRLANDATPHQRWSLDGTEGTAARSTIASIVGDPESSFGSGCYWSTDGVCGGHFSCSGRVLVWDLDAARFSASTSCSGGCPCGAVLNGTLNADGSIEASYRGVNCDRSYEGELSARPLD